MSISYKKFFLLFFSIIIFSGFVKSQNSLSIYSPNFSSTYTGGWQINGTTQFLGNPQYMSITRDAGNQAGSAFWKNKVALSPNFSFSVFFTMQMSNTVCRTRADGITFCIQQASNTAGSAGGGLGYSGLPGKSIAIEYDTYNNYGPNNNHIALDINGALHAGNSPNIAAINASTLDLADGQIKYNWIDFDGVNNVLEVRISNSNVRPATATLRVTGLNLATIFPNPNVYFGFTAATGGACAEQDILGVLANNSYNPFGDNPFNGGGYSQAISNVVVTSSNNVSCPAQKSILTVTATDPNNLPVPNAVLNLAVISGSGTLTSTTVTTNANGVALDTISNINGSNAVIQATDPVAGAYGTVTVTNLSGVTISGSLVGCISGSSQLTGAGTAASASPWVSSNPSVATVSNTGLVTVLSNGTSTITYTNNAGCSVSALFTGGVSISGNASLCVNTTSQLTGTGTAANTNPWVSSNTSIATVSNTGLVTAIAAGTTTITYTTANGCTATFLVTVNGLPTSAPVVSVTQPSCSIPSGTIIVTSPLNANYLYSLDGINYQSSTTFNSVVGGSYNVRIKTTSGCLGTTSTSVITALVAQPTYTLVQPTCTTGTINITSPTGASYQYSVDGGTTYQSTTSFTQLSGNYKLVVKNSINCISSPTLVTLNNPTSASVLITNPTAICTPNTANLTATKITTGSTTGLTYSYWTDAAATNALSNPSTVATAGTYYIKGTSGSCFNIQPVVVTVNAPTSIPAITGTTSLCPGATTTLANTTSSGVWSSSNTSVATISNSGVVSSLTSGTSTISYTVTNNVGCPSISTATFTVNAIPTISQQPSTSSQSICKNANPVALTVDASAGSGTITTYEWYSNTTNATTNGTLVATHTSTTTSDSYTPVTSNSGTLYYYVVITNSNGCSIKSASSGSIIVANNEAPTITTQPIGVTDFGGASASFITSASGLSLTYQWQLSSDGNTWSPIIGSTGTTLLLQNIGASPHVSGNQYRIVATNACGSVNSSAATLTVNANSSISSQPTDVSICESNTATFSVQAQGSNLSYQWQGSFGGAAYINLSTGLIYSNVTTSTLNLSAVPFSLNSAKFRCIVSGQGASSALTSNPGILTVSQNATITIQPTTLITSCSNNQVSFTIQAVGSGVANGSYQWQESSDSLNYTDISNANSNVLTLTASSSLHRNRYRCIVNGTCNIVTSNAAILDIVTPTSVSVQPTNQTICTSSNTTIPFTALGNKLTYQWEVSTDNGVSFANVPTSNYVNATTNTLGIQGVPFTFNTYKYRCSILGTCNPGSPIYTTPITLTVNPLTSITVQPSASSVCAPNNVTMSATTNGTSLSHLWKVSSDGGTTFTSLFDGGFYSGVTTNNLTITGDASLHQKIYQLNVSGSCGPSVTSNSAKLTINTVPNITSQSSDMDICIYGTAYISITNAGLGNTYQWQESANGTTWTNLTNQRDPITYFSVSGVNTNALRIFSLPASKNGFKYRCVVFGCNSTVNSTPVTITVKAKPAVTMQPVNANNNININNSPYNDITTTTYVFKSTVSGWLNNTDANIFQWKQSTDGGRTYSNVSTGTAGGLTYVVTSNPSQFNTTLSVTMPATTSVANKTKYIYRCLITGYCDIVTTNAATINPPPKLN